MNLFRLCTGGEGNALAAGGGLAALLVLGLSGSLLHCGPMCGPLVLGQTVHRLACIPCARMGEGARWRAGLLLPYHAGRITTYAALGALAGGAGGAAFAITQPVRVFCLLVAALFLLALAAGGLRPGVRGPFFLGRLAGQLRPGGYFFGLALGLMPCGLLYGALLAAMATGSAARGAAGMLAFGIGTVPVLAAIGVAGRVDGLRVHLRAAMPVLLVLNACILFAAALQAAHLV